ncbi:MAG: hypothetical protein PQ975_12335 [Methanobacterium sp.]
MSRIWGLEELVAKGKITKKHADKIMLEFIYKSVKLEEEKGICIYDVVNEENLNDYLKGNDNEETDFFDNKTSVCKNCGHLIRRKFDSYFLWQHFTHYIYNLEAEIMVDIIEAEKEESIGPMPIEQFFKELEEEANSKTKTGI